MKVKKLLVWLLVWIFASSSLFEVANAANSTEVKDLHLYFVNGTETKHYTIMDRNMGATAVGDGWYYYQWWNNYGFTHPLTNTTTTQVPYDTWHLYEAAPSTYSSSAFVIGSSNAYTWTEEQRFNNNLWWWKNDTTYENWTWTKEDRQWPCPDWYYIPSAHDAYSLIWAWTWSSPDFDINKVNTAQSSYDKFASALLLPLDWSIGYRDWKLELQWDGTVWTSSPTYGPRHSNPSEDYPTNQANNARVMYFKAGQFGTYNTIGVRNISNWQHIRCFKNDFQTDLTIHLQAGQKTVITVDEDGKIYALYDPTHSSGTDFQWWYTTPEFINWTKVDTGSNLKWVTDLYPRWAGDEESFVVTIESSDTNSGSVSIGSITVAFGTVLGTLSGNPITVDGKTVTATESTDTDQYDFSFVDWTHNCGATVTAWCTITANFKSEVKKYTIVFVDGDGNIVQNWMLEHGTTPVYAWSTPTKSASAWYMYEFEWWTPNIVDVVWDATYTANFKEIRISNWWGWSILRKDKCPNGDYSDSYYDWDCGTPKDEQKNESQDEEKTTYESAWDEGDYTDEEMSAYDWAYKNWITTMPTIKEANMYGYIIRSHLAKMMSQFAINVVWAKPNIWKEWCDKFNDIANETDELKWYMKTACELWLMWLHADGKTVKDNFDPNNYVTRAEFGTVLSRFLYLDENNLTTQEIQEWAEWYSKHLSALKLNWIMTQIDGERITSKELRWYVMLMLMRSAQ